MGVKISDEARRAVDVVIRIDQGDYLQLRGGYDWGRAECKDAGTWFNSVAEAEAEIERLKLQGIAREIEPLWDEDS